MRKGVLEMKDTILQYFSRSTLLLCSGMFRTGPTKNGKMSIFILTTTGYYFQNLERTIVLVLAIVHTSFLFLNEEKRQFEMT